MGYLARWVSATNEAVGCCYTCFWRPHADPFICAAPQAVALLRALRLYCRGVSSGDRFRWFLAELCASGGAACGGAPKGRYFSSGYRAAPRAAPGLQNHLEAFAGHFAGITENRSGSRNRIFANFVSREIFVKIGKNLCFKDVMLFLMSGSTRRSSTVFFKLFDLRLQHRILAET